MPRRGRGASPRRLGIDDVAAEVLPDDKAARVAAWQAQGQRVAMVGDGVNDAPALAQADLGIAMGTGTDVAIAAAGITLLRGDPALVPAAIEVARRTQAKIRQNLAWAFGYNVVGLPLAAFGDALAGGGGGGDGAVLGQRAGQRAAAGALAAGGGRRDEYRRGGRARRASRPR